MSFMFVCRLIVLEMKAHVDGKNKLEAILLRKMLGNGEMEEKGSDVRYSGQSTWGITVIYQMMVDSWVFGRCSFFLSF